MTPIIARYLTLIFSSEQFIGVNTPHATLRTFTRRSSVHASGSNPGVWLLMATSNVFFVWCGRPLCVIPEFAKEDGCTLLNDADTFYCE